MMATAETHVEVKEMADLKEMEKQQEEEFKFHSVANFRDLAGPLTSVGICKNLIFRSGTLDNASKHDMEALTQKYSIRTILDLRSKNDADTKVGPFAVFPRVRKVRLGARVNTAAAQAKPDKRRIINRGVASKTIMINFTGASYRKYVWGQLNNHSRGKLVLYRAFNTDKAAKLVGEEVLNQGGLNGLYCSFIDYSGEAIGLALKVLVSAMNYPILIHCAQGKDRTGIVTALAMAAIGVDEETIIADYVLSRMGLEKIYPKVVSEMARRGLNPSFADSPAETMKEMFQHIRQKYGSVERYLDSIGFSEQFRVELKNTLLHNAREFIERIQPKKEEK